MPSWIKMRTDLHDDPKVITIKRHVGARNVHSVTGALLHLWSLGDTYTTDGELQGYTGDYLNEMMGMPKFAEALALPEVDWLELRPNSIVIKRFDKHNGASAKRRALGADRQQEHRERNAPSVTEALPDKIREDKRRKSGVNATARDEGDSRPSPTPPNGTEKVALSGRRRSEPTGDHADLIRHFAAGWKVRYGTDYPLKRGKDHAHFSWILEKSKGDLAKARQAIDAFLRDDDPKVCQKKHPLGWLVSGFQQYLPTPGGNGVAPLTAARIYDI